MPWGPNSRAMLCAIARSAALAAANGAKFALPRSEPLAPVNTSVPPLRASSTGIAACARWKPPSACSRQCELEPLFADFQERRRPVRAGVVHGHRQRSERLRRLDEAGHVGRLRRIADDIGHLRTGGSEFGRRGGELLRVAAGNGDGVTAGGEAAGDRCAKSLRGADA